MNKSLLRFFCVATMATGAAAAMSAAEAIEGYFRVQSALGTADQSGYVEVRGPLTTAPDVTKENALTSAGTVMRLRAFPETRNGVTRYKIGNLSSQGIEVFGAPKADYMAAINELVGNIDTSDYVAAAYSLQRHGREIGYIATGRVIVQALFQIVAERLDSEIASLPKETQDRLNSGETLGEFATRFNQEVSANIDLHAYLEPVADNQYRLYFNWIDCAGVSEFYLKNEQNKKSFELGFECMRHYMNNKPGLSPGEVIDANEAKLWKQWGYDISKNYADCYDAANDVYTLSYEKIFADHEVLYNWLKMYIERFLDPAKAPNAEILGINFKDFATEMQKHAIMQGFLKYIPSIQEGQKLYLTSGRFSDGVNEYSTVGTASDNSQHFGLLGEEQALAAGNAAVWNLLPLDETDNYFAIKAVAHRENKPGETDGHLAALYFDFPFEALHADQISFYTLGGAPMPVQTAQLTNLGAVDYVVIDMEQTKVARRTPVLVDAKTTTITNNIVKVIYEAQESDYNPEVTDIEEKPSGFEVSDEVVDNQRAPRRAQALAAGETQSYSVMLNTPVNENALKHLWNIDADLSTKSVYGLTTREEKKSEETKQAMRTPWFTEISSIPANHSFLVSDKRDTPTGISLNAPADEMLDRPTGIESIEADSMQPDVIYDLNGRKVNSVRAGQIYILNGNKILVK